MSAENMAYVERIIRDVVIGCDCDVFWNRNIGSGPIIAGVNVSDTFAYACADSENIEPHEIDDLIAEMKADPIYGDTLWAAKKRGQRPIDPLLLHHGMMSKATEEAFRALPPYMQPAPTETTTSDRRAG